MTDNEIIKALECCINDDCDNCPDTFGNCEHNAMRNALNLINRQQADIERLQKINDSFTDIGKLYSEVKAEVVKEFAERLKKIIRLEDDCQYDCVNCYYECGDYVIDIDNLVKEMVGNTE